MKVKTQLLLGIAGLSILATPAFSQTAQPAAAAATPDAPATADIVVTGIRASQRASQDLKRNASVIVDAITATDVGKFPDPNIADALQRITGVAIQRDSTGEGQFITVRGLGPEFNNVLVNGRTMATDNIGREFSFDTLSSSIISRTEVYKTAQPQLQEGGIGSTVNIETTRPLDTKGFHLSAQAGGTYDLSSKKTTPDLGGVVSYANPDRTFGIVASVNYKQRKSQTDDVQTQGWFPLAPGANTVGLINGTPTSVGLPASAITPLNPTGTQTVWIPQNENFQRAQINSQRLSANLTLQARPTDTLLVTLDGLYSAYKVDDTQNYFAGYFTPPYFANLTTDANGTVTAFTRPGTNFTTNNPLVGASNQQNDNVVQEMNRNSKSWQIGGNVKWDAAPNLKFEADLSKSHASQDLYNPFVVVGSNPALAPTYSNNGATIPTYNPGSSITDPSTLRAHYINVQDHQYADNLTEARLQGEWKADLGVLKSIQFGGLFSFREKTDNEFTTPGANYCAYCGYAVPVPSNLTSPYYLNNFLTQSSGSNTVPNQFFTFDPNAIISYLSQPSILATRSAGELTNVPTATFIATGGYTPVLQPTQGFDVTEQVFSSYINTNWGGHGWAANVGVRIASTNTTSSGFQSQLTKIQQNVGDSNLNFTYGPVSPISVSNHYVDVLPSANLKVDLAPKLIGRLAISKTLTRPTLSDLGTNNSYAGRVTAATSTGGNPYLTPFTSWNYDASLEYYASRNASITADVFRKQFSGFITESTLQIPRAGFASDGVTPVTYTFSDTRPRNGNSGSITGAEIAAQYAFGGEGILSGFGLGANYTYVTSSINTQSPTDCSSLEGLSKSSYNVNGYYEKHGVQARLAYNWRSSFLSKCYGQLSDQEYTAAYGQLDFNASVDVTKNVQVFVEGANLTNSYIYQYTIYTNRLLLDESTGRRISFGVRAKF